MRYEKEDKRFFHASPRRFQVGQTLTASCQVKKNYQWCEQGIFVTDNLRRITPYIMTSKIRVGICMKLSLCAV